MNNKATTQKFWKAHNLKPQEHPDFCHHVEVNVLQGLCFAMEAGGFGAPESLHKDAKAKCQEGVICADSLAMFAGEFAKDSTPGRLHEIMFSFRDQAANVHRVSGKMLEAQIMNAALMAACDTSPDPTVGLPRRISTRPRRR
jgi:hypothetical protein